MSTVTLNFRATSDEKLAFFELCNQRGVSPSWVLRTAMNQMTQTGRLPVQTRSWDEVPETVEAIKELEAGLGKRYSSYDEMMKDILND